MSPIERDNLDSYVDYRLLMQACSRVVDDRNEYLEIEVNGLTLRVFPSRLVNSDDCDRKEAIKQFATFMLAIADRLRNGMMFALSIEDGLEIGAGPLSKTIEHYTYMPVEIVGYAPPITMQEPRLSFSFDRDTDVLASVSAGTRRIRL